MGRQVSTVSIEDAYAEACKALGESMVMQRLQGLEIVRLTALAQQPPAQEPTTVP